MRFSKEQMNHVFLGVGRAGSGDPCLGTCTCVLNLDCSKVFHRGSLGEVEME